MFSITTKPSGAQVIALPTQATITHPPGPFTLQHPGLITLFFVVLAIAFYSITTSRSARSEINTLKTQLSNIIKEHASLQRELISLREEAKEQRDSYIDERLDLLEGFDHMQTQRKDAIKSQSRLLEQVEDLKRRREIDNEERESLIETVKELIARLDTGKDDNEVDEASNNIWEAHRRSWRRSQGTAGEDSGFADFDSEVGSNGCDGCDGCETEDDDVHGAPSLELRRFSEPRLLSPVDKEFNDEEESDPPLSFSKQSERKKEYRFSGETSCEEELEHGRTGSHLAFTILRGEPEAEDPLSTPNFGKVEYSSLENNSNPPSKAYEDEPETDPRDPSMDFHDRLQQRKTRLLENLERNVPATPLTEKRAGSPGLEEDERWKLSRRRSLRRAMSRVIGFGGSGGK